MQVKEYVTLPKLAKSYNMSRITAKREAEQSGAMYFFGGGYRVDIKAFDDYIRSKKVKEGTANDSGD